jgi:hypothetical protein
VIITDPTKLGSFVDSLGSPPVPPVDDTLGFVSASREGKHFLTLLRKRTYRISQGRCHPARAPEPLVKQEIPYDASLKGPDVSPPAFVNEGHARKPKTDVIVQGDVHAVDPGTRRLTASVRFGRHRREIAVFGERRGEYVGASPRFSEPEPFESVPLRWDFAYGGCDRFVLAREGFPFGEELARVRPEIDAMAATPYHYPRNPCGRGYLVALERDAFEGLLLPALEHAAEPLSPLRLAQGSPERWLHAPLPACWDWQSERFFPRMGYLGFTPPHAGDTIPAEVKRGWASPDLLSIRPVLHGREPTVSLEHAQAAAPGMSVDDLLPGQRVELRHLHPKRVLMSFDLPDETPDVKLGLGGPALTDLVPHLDSVVIRPDPGEVVVVWSLRAEVRTIPSYEQAATLKRVERWVRREGFVAKLSGANGAHVWSQTIENSNQSDLYAVATSAAGDVFVG